MLSELGTCANGAMSRSHKGVALAETVEVPVVEESTPYRALPGWAVDRLRDGLGKRPRGNKLWGQLVRIAMSAQRRGWTRNQFFDELATTALRVGDDGRKRWCHWKLWDQVVEVARSEKKAWTDLERAWSAAGMNLLRDNSLRTPEDLVATAIEWAFEWSDRLDSGEDKLKALDVTIMLYVSTEIERRRYARVTCPSREVAVWCGLSDSDNVLVWRRLKSLDERGFLRLFDKGRQTNKGGSGGKAAIYALGNPFTLPIGGFKKTFSSKTASKRSSKSHPKSNATKAKGET